MGIVGDDMGGATDNCAGENEIIVYAQCKLHATVKRLLVALSPLLLVILLACQRVVTQVPTPVAIPPTSPTANPVRQNEATPSPMLPGPARASSTATPTAVRNAALRPSKGPQFEKAYVLRVVDGDTIEVELDGRRYKVRYIGVDAPETKHPAKPIECFGHEATEKNRELVEGKTVYLEKDVSETDRYGRLLRYVHLADGTFVNAELVRLGYAQVATYPPDVRYIDLFLRFQRQARQADRGLWGKCER